MALPSGAKYVAGTGRAAVLLTGGYVVTRSVAENLGARERGFRSEYARRQAFAASKGGVDYETGLEAAQANGFSPRDYNYARALMIEDNRVNGWRNRDRAPGGILDQYLQMIGRRDGTETWYVGDSPGVQS